MDRMDCISANRIRNLCLSTILKTKTYELDLKISIQTRLHRPYIRIHKNVTHGMK